jgi:hypothetical protein
LLLTLPPLAVGAAIANLLALLVVLLIPANSTCAGVSIIGEMLLVVFF